MWNSPRQALHKYITLRLSQIGHHFADDIFQCIFLKKIFEFWLKFHWNLFPLVKSTIFQHWFRWWLGAIQATSHYLNLWCLINQRTYASLGLNETSKISHGWNIASLLPCAIDTHKQCFVPCHITMHYKGINVVDFDNQCTPLWLSDWCMHQ